MAARPGSFGTFALVLLLAVPVGSAGIIREVGDWWLYTQDQVVICAVNVEGCADGVAAPVLAYCGDLDCDPAADEDGDGIPDLTEWELCGVSITRTFIDEAAIGLGECRSETDYVAPADAFPYATPLQVLRNIHP